jgi:GNAT superfamily N-acetyltransferase
VRSLNDNNLVLREAHSFELEDVSLLIRDAYQQYEHILPPEEWIFYLQDMMDVRGRLNESQLIIAEIGGKLAGAVTLYLNYTHPSPAGWPSGWAGIRLLAVHSAFRGRGVGRALMEERVRRCRNHGIGTIGLHTTEMMDVARRLYEKMGFEREPGYDFHPGPDVTVMAYRLNLKPQAAIT